MDQFSRHCGFRLCCSGFRSHYQFFLKFQILISALKMTKLATLNAITLKSSAKILADYLRKSSLFFANTFSLSGSLQKVIASTTSFFYEVCKVQKLLIKLVVMV
jgi:hypothetical protein